MVRIDIVPVQEADGGVSYQARAGDRRSRGRTAGEALDAITPQLAESESATLVIVQSFRPDVFFDGGQQRRLTELMARWREARDRGIDLPAEERAELNALIDEEVLASGRRAAALVEHLRP